MSLGGWAGSWAGALDPAQRARQSHAACCCVSLFCMNNLAAASAATPCWQASALGMLRGRGYEVAQRGCALLGYVAAGGTAGVLLATRVRKKATLPGGHAVYLVTDSQWVLIPLQVGPGRAGAGAPGAGWGSAG